MRLQIMAQSTRVRWFCQIPSFPSGNPTRPSLVDADGDEVNSVHNFGICRQRRSRCGAPCSSLPSAHIIFYPSQFINKRYPLIDCFFYAHMTIILLRYVIMSLVNISSSAIPSNTSSQSNFNIHHIRQSPSCLMVKQKQLYSHSVSNSYLHNIFQKS